MGLNSAVHVTAADKRLTFLAICHVFPSRSTYLVYLDQTQRCLNSGRLDTSVAWIRDGRAIVRTGNNRTLRADVVTVSVCPALHRPSPCRMRTSWHIYVVYPYRCQLSGFEGLGASTIEA